MDLAQTSSLAISKIGSGGRIITEKRWIQDSLVILRDVFAIVILYIKKMIANRME